MTEAPAGSDERRAARANEGRERTRQVGWMVVSVVFLEGASKLSHAE